jgi:hypothetical protein
MQFGMNIGIAVVRCGKVSSRVNRAREQQAQLPFPHFPTANLSR